MKQCVDVPFYAIGGITEENLSSVIEAGATRVAVGQAIWKANDLESVASRMKEQLQQAAVDCSSFR